MYRQGKKPRVSQDKYESYSELSNSPQHPPPEDIPRIKAEVMDKPLDLKTKPDPERLEEIERRTEPPRTETLRPEKVDKCIQTVEKSKPLEIKIDANSMSILPEDHFDDDKLFMNSLIPCFKKMNDDTRLLCRIEVLKIIRYALQGNTCFEAHNTAEDSFFKDRMNGTMKEELVEQTQKSDSVSTLSMTTRSADGSRPIRKRRVCIKPKLP
ncbi:Uncharacterized protein OBRU01_12506 [Operophtera brumata]|uniref:BESS domain-containing protein n=1 Tax=Operophtera brumata TaxID=104452 RepID=A0A0L7L683_OPEBR|nr:Uncharacterized protein OBRU01_12506 [Operophtera brumata]